MRVALEHAWWVSPEEYLQGEDLAETRHEYVGGIVYGMAGATNRHNKIAGNVLVELGVQLRGRSCEPFNSDTKVRIRNGDDVRFYYPDAMVVCDPNDLDEVFQDRPVVLFEVLSESTARVDREEKLRAYQSITAMRAYAVIESECVGVTLYHRANEGTGWAVKLWRALGDHVRLEAIDCTLSLDAIYAGTDL